MEAGAPAPRRFGDPDDQGGTAAPAPNLAKRLLGRIPAGYR
ncbi:hypothetical protein GCM10009800_10420 [Nocardiopsis rhodophaea]